MNHATSLHHAFTSTAARQSIPRFAQAQGLTLEQLEESLGARDVRTQRDLTSRLARYRASALADEAATLALATLTNLLVDYNAQRSADQDHDEPNFLVPDDPSRIKPETARMAAALLSRLTLGRTTMTTTNPPPLGGGEAKPKAEQGRGEHTRGASSRSTIDRPLSVSFAPDGELDISSPRGERLAHAQRSLDLVLAPQAGQDLINDRVAAACLELASERQGMAPDTNARGPPILFLSRHL